MRQLFAAARRHGLTPSAVARRVDALEAALGCQLFSRSTHAVRAMPAALAFAERARRIVQELHGPCRGDILDSAPEGRIRIDAPAPFGRRHLAPALAEFLQAYPGVDIQLRLIDSFVDLHGEHLGEVDLVLRIGPLADTRTVATPWRRWCASSAPARPTGASRRAADPEQLPEHDGLDWDALAPPHAWRFERNGRSQVLRPGVCGWWPTMLKRCWRERWPGSASPTCRLISEYLLRGELLPLFCEGGLPQPEASGIYALRLTREADSRTRLLLEFLKSRFGPVPPWDRALNSGLKRVTVTDSGFRFPG